MEIEGGGGVPVTYVVSFPPVMKMVRFPVTGCLTLAHSTGRIREIFMYRHFFARVAVVQEGRETLRCYDMCGMHISEGRLLKHQQT